jgi:hypothetical protein
MTHLSNSNTDPDSFYERILKSVDVIADVLAEREYQYQQWGEQNHPDGTGRPGDRENADYMRAICKANGPAEDNWRDILAEEIAEAFAESEPGRLREELIQCAAVCVAWVEAIDSRTP